MAGVSDMDKDFGWPGWQTVRVIGRGSFGAVYEIKREVFGHEERAAMKWIAIPQSDKDVEDLMLDGYDEESLTKRFEGYLQDIVREYSMMADMKGCANIVYCDDVKYIQQENGIGWNIFIKMELLTPMAKALGKTIPEEQVIKLGKDMCSALVFCEERNVIHRDIKPQNIFIAPDGTYKLGDFGIAKTAERTTSGTKTGTYKYMAPEVYNNQPYGARADIYSLGLVLYWMLNDRRTPFLPLPPAVPGPTEEDDARRRRFSGEVIPPPAYGSRRLKAIVLKACAFNPEERYRTAQEMLTDLNALTIAAYDDEETAAPYAGGVLHPEKPTTGKITGASTPWRRTEDAYDDADDKTSKVSSSAGKNAGGIPGKAPEKAPEREPEKKPAEPPEKKPESGTSDGKKKGLLLIPAVAVIVLIAVFAIRGLGPKADAKPGATAEPAVETEAPVVTEAPTPEPLRVSLSLSEESLEMGVGEEHTLTADLDAPEGVRVLWESSDPEVAAVTEDGLISAVGVGTAQIIAAASEGDASAACEVDVRIKVTGITFKQTARKVRVGSKPVIEFTIFPADATNQELIWTSSNPSVIEVDENGQIRVLKAGGATIKATTVDGGFTAECKFTVQGGGSSGERPPEILG